MMLEINITEMKENVVCNRIIGRINTFKDGNYYRRKLCNNKKGDQRVLICNPKLILNTIIFFDGYFYIFFCIIKYTK